MPDYGIGATGYVGYAKETVEGTRVAPTKFLAANSVSFNDSNDYLTPLPIRGDRDITVAMPAPFIVQGTLETNLPVDDIGYLLKSAFAASVSTSNYSGVISAYTHTFTPGSTSPTFSFETSPGTDNTLVMAYTGVRVNTMEIRSAFGEIVTATFGLDGVGRAKQASAATPTYAATSVYPFHFNGATVSIGGAASSVVKEFTFGVNNNVEHIGTLQATRAYKRVALGPREMTLSMGIDFYDATEYNRLLNDDEFAVVLTLDGPTLTGAGGGQKARLSISLPRVKYRTVGLPISAGDFLTQDVECTVLKPSGSAIASVTLTNHESSLA